MHLRGSFFQRMQNQLYFQLWNPWKCFKFLFYIFSSPQMDFIVFEIKVLFIEPFCKLYTIKKESLLLLFAASKSLTVRSLVINKFYWKPLLNRANMNAVDRFLGVYWKYMCMYASFAFNTICKYEFAIRCRHGFTSGQSSSITFYL